MGSNIGNKGKDKKVTATGQRKKPCCKAGKKKVTTAKKKDSHISNSYEKRRISYKYVNKKNKKNEKKQKKNPTRQENKRTHSEHYTNYNNRKKIAWKVKAGKKKVEKIKVSSREETGEKFSKGSYASSGYQQFYQEAIRKKEYLENTEVRKRPFAKRAGSFVFRSSKTVLKVAAKGTFKAAKGTVKVVAKETAEGTKAFVKSDIEQQKGGKELLQAVQTEKTLIKDTKKVADMGVEIGKTMYRSGKSTAKFLAGVHAKNEYSGKGYSYGDGKSSEKKQKKPEKSREAYRKGQKKKQESIARKRIRKYMQNKFSSNPNKQDSIGSVVKDIVKGVVTKLGKKFAGWVAKKVILLIAGAIGGLMVTVMPLILVVVMLSSPFGMFFQEEDSDTLQSVLSEYYQEFIQEIDKEVNADGYDKIQVKSYTGQVDINVSKNNIADVLCVFAEKYGYELEIAEVSKKVKKKLKSVFDDMNYYSVSEKKTTKTNKKGETIEKKTKIITITQKNWQDMLEPYQFGKDEKKEIKELMEMVMDEGMVEDEDEEVYSAYTGGDTCIDGKVYDNNNAPVYKGIHASVAKKTKKYIRPILKKKGMEPYIDIVVSMVQQESTFGQGDNANWLQVNGYSGKSGMASCKAGIDHLEGLIKMCKAKKITDIKTLVQSYNFGEAYIGFIKQNGGKDTPALQKTFQYKQRKDGRYGTAGYSVSVMSRVKGAIPKIASMPMYYQTDGKWGKCSFGSSTIAKSGCGVCSLSMVVSYWTGKEITPPKMVKNCHSYYVPGAGASWNMITDISLKYGLTCKSLGTSKKDMVKELKKGHTIIAIMHTGYFTKGGHYIVLRTIDSKGNISINDCGSRQRTAKTYSADFIQSQNAANYWSIYK